MIQISNLTKKYGETVVFSNLNYTFENTCIYGLVGRNVVSYNVQNELRLVRKGFPLRYSLKEKLQCKSVIGMFLLLLPMLCYWIAYKIELFSIILWIWIPIQSIIIYTAKNRLQRLLYILPFYILSLLSMRVWQMFF